MEIGGYNEQVDWPKLGPSLLIATCLVVAIRTAKWPAQVSEHVSSVDLDKEVEFAAHVAGRVLSHLVAKKDSMFPSKRVPWYQPGEEDDPK